GIEPEDQPVAAVDRDGPLVSPVPAQLVEANAPQPAEIVQRLRRVELAQAQSGPDRVQAGPGCLAIFGESPCGRVLPGADHMWRVTRKACHVKRLERAGSRRRPPNGDHADPPPIAMRPLI